MKITNNSDLPQPLVSAVTNDKYSKGDSDYSITQLLKPPRATALEALHKDELEVDAADLIWSLLGTLTHEILDRAEEESIPRDRLYMWLAGKKVSGATDRFVLKDGLLQDWKVTSVWKVKKSLKEFDLEWAAQLNGYIMLLDAAGYKVTKAQIVPIMRDWSKPQAGRDEYYPQQQALKLNSPIWDVEYTKNYFSALVVAHELAKKTLPLCTNQQRWMADESWAAIKGNNKKAARLFYSPEEAYAYCQDEKRLGFYSVVHRLGTPKRCESYCLASRFCSQYLEEACASSLPWPSQQ